jgi:hypothetical protein
MQKAYFFFSAALLVVLQVRVQAQVDLDHEADIVESIDNFVENSGKLREYAAAINFSSWDFELADVNGPTELRGEIMLYVNEESKFRNVTYRREVRTQGGVIANPWNTELRVKGDVFTLNGRGKEPAKSTNLLCKFDPFELSVGIYDDFLNGACATGYLVSLVDTKQLVAVKSDYRNLSYTLQRWPENRRTVVTSKKVGGMPIFLSSIVSIDPKTGRNRPSRVSNDFNFLLGETFTDWIQKAGIWLPSSIQMDRIYSLGDKKAKRRYEFAFAWLIGDSLSKFDRKKFESTKVEIQSQLFTEVSEHANASKR